MGKIFTPIIDILQNEKNLIIVGHEDPDCDSVASILSLYLTFGGKEKNWYPLVGENVPMELRFLPGIEFLCLPQDLPSDYGNILLVDCDTPERAGAFLPPLIAGRKLYCIDHHISNGFLGDVVIVDPKAAATTELISLIIEEAGLPISDEAALCLYSGMSADSGGFRFISTTARTMACAGKLVPQVDLETVQTNLFESRTIENIKMLAVCLNNIQVDSDGLLCYSYISREEQLAHNATEQDCNRIVNFTMAIFGVKMGLLFEEGEGHVKISLRARRGYRVDEIAKELGGGGHMQAAGCKIPGDLTLVMPLAIAKAKEEILRRGCLYKSE